MSKLTTIEGIGETYEKALKEAGITSVESFLKACAESKGRKTTAEKTGLSDKLILKWTNHADLFRIKGVAGEYAELLEAAGVDTVPELSHRNAVNLLEKIIEANNTRKLVRQIPRIRQLEDWIAQAKKLPRVVNY